MYGGGGGGTIISIEVAPSSTSSLLPPSQLGVWTTIPERLGVFRAVNLPPSYPPPPPPLPLPPSSLSPPPPPQVSGTHYPERLGVFMVVDPPGIFTILWKAIQAFVDPKTYTKIRCVLIWG